MPPAIQSIDTSPYGPTSRQQRLLDDQDGFAAVLSRANESESKNPARDAAEKLVAVAFVQPVLTKLRESANAAPPFQANQAEKAFRGMMDNALAQKIVKSERWSLVDRIASKLNREAPPAAPPARPNQKASTVLGESQIKGPADAHTPSPFGMDLARLGALGDHA